MKPLLAALICLFVSATAVAFDPLETEQKIQHQDTEIDWKEDKVKIPDHINSDDLQAFTVAGADNRFQYFIERGSLVTGDDWVTRFVLVIRSNAGAVNSSYEGLRCGYRTYKVYAYGDAKHLTSMPGADWQPILRICPDVTVLHIQILALKIGQQPALKGVELFLPVLKRDRTSPTLGPDLTARCRKRPDALEPSYERMGSAY